MRASNDIKYQHLQEELHVEITAFAPPAEAHARIAYALTEVRKYLIPDSNDEIRQEQMREMEIMTGVHPAAASADGISMAVPAVALQAAAAACAQQPKGMQPNAAQAVLGTPVSQFAALASAMQQQPLRSAVPTGLPQAGGVAVTSTTGAVTANLLATASPQSLQQAVAAFRQAPFLAQINSSSPLAFITFKK